MKINLKVEKLTEVQLPNKAHPTDAGTDFYLPYDLKYIMKNGKSIKIGLYEIKTETGDIIESTAIVIEPHKSVLLPMGVKLEFNPDYCLFFVNRSGMATKKHLFRGACLVDSGYRGELFVNLTNVSDETQYLLPGEKLIQGIFLPVPSVEIVENDVDVNTDRGEGGFGSTDK